jgi:hypothetical protein
MQRYLLGGDRFRLREFAPTCERSGKFSVIGDKSFNLSQIISQAPRNDT